MEVRERRSEAEAAAREALAVAPGDLKARVRLARALSQRADAGRADFEEAARFFAARFNDVSCESAKTVPGKKVL